MTAVFMHVGMASILDHVGTGFQAALTPTHLLYCFVGVVIGTFIGMLPGLGAATGISLLLPVTIGLDPLSALILLAGIYYGCMHGGIVSAVLIGTPGDPASIVTVLDGHKLGRAGRAGPVLAMSALSSFLAGTLTIPFVMLLTDGLQDIALKFGPPEISAVILLALASVVGLVGRDRVKGFAMVAIGIAISTIGLDPNSGIPRFTFGVPALFGGIDFVYVVMGTFAVAEVLHAVGTHRVDPIRTRFRDMLIRRDDWRQARFSILRGGILGFLCGLLPGAGATTASFLSYDMERRIGLRKGRRLGSGSGCIEGVTGPQAADNAAANSAFISTLSLGIPGSASTAVLLAGFLLHNIQPGPLLLTTEPALSWGLLASFYLGNVMLIMVNIPLAPVFASLLRIKYKYLYPAILLICFIGAFAINDDMTGPWLVLIFGAVGWGAKKYGYPLAPLVIGVVLGNTLATDVQQSAEIGRGSLLIYLRRPISVGLLCLVLLVVFGPMIWRFVRRRIDTRPRRGVNNANREMEVAP